eukprot:g39674.t1
MSAIDYVALDGGTFPANDVSNRVKTAAGWLGLLLTGVASWWLAAGARILSSSSSTSRPRGFPFMPAQGNVKDIMVRPNPAGTALAFPPPLPEGPSCVFSYDGKMVVPDDTAVTQREAWLYGAKLEEGSALAYPSGDVQDILTGRLFCWKPQLSTGQSLAVAAGLKMALLSQERQHKKARRQEVTVVMQDGSLSRAYAYLRDAPGKTIFDLARRPDNDEELANFEVWYGQLTQAVAAEAASGYQDVQNRRERFSISVRRLVGKVPDIVLNKKKAELTKMNGVDLRRYVSYPPSERQRVLKELQDLLRAAREEVYEVSNPPKPVKKVATLTGAPAVAVTEEDRAKEKAAREEREFWEREERELAETLKKLESERAQLEQMMGDPNRKWTNVDLQRMQKQKEELQKKEEEAQREREKAEREAREKAEQAKREAVQPNTPLNKIEELAPKTVSRLTTLGLTVARELFEKYYPKEYKDESQKFPIAALKNGKSATIVGTVIESDATVSPHNASINLLTLDVQDKTGKLKVYKHFALPPDLQKKFRLTQKQFLKKLTDKYPVGCVVAVSGVISEGSSHFGFSNPTFQVLNSINDDITIGKLMPIYTSAQGLSSDALRQAIWSVLPYVRHWPDPLPQEMRKEYNLMSWPNSMRHIHKPPSRDKIPLARSRIVFDEFLMLQLQLGQRRLASNRQAVQSLSLKSGQRDLVGQLVSLLPFNLTGAQWRVIHEIQQDLAKSHPMGRLVQGDVGSGKTVVALAALLTAIEAGSQGAFIAPTQILAEQHFNKFSSWLPKLGVTYALLTGSTRARERPKILKDLKFGDLQLIIGTHALLEDEVQFERLGLVVVDEQHRFGVKQRSTLLAKGMQTHLLTMTATPIPRTLALSLHGDLDVSQIDEVPPGRTPILTSVLSSDERYQAYKLIREQVALGQRAYVVLPLVQESEKMDLRSAVETSKELADEFPDFVVGLLHGKMSGDEKSKAINSFAAGETQVLVSTTVVEVGVDVPEASVMLIEHADRFGLAQLHQLRGRVGRGAAASYCVLMYDGDNEKVAERLEVLARSIDGFEIAETDMRLRGPGQFLGTKQSGSLPEFSLADLSEDGEELELARKVARRLLKEDPELEHYPVLRATLQAHIEHQREQN